MEADDGVVQRVADDRQKGRDDVGGDFHVEEQAGPCVDAHHDQHVVEEREQGHHAHAGLAVARGDDHEDGQA